MIVELGHFALILAFCVATVQCAVPMLGLATRRVRLLELADAAAIPLFALILASFLALMYAHIESDFSVSNVFLNSHSAKPLIYKISGVWGNHEGSMLLWVLILVTFGAAVSVFGGSLPRDLRSVVLAVQALISALFILFIVATSNPFTRLAAAPAEGQGLNPILQDPALAIHPPLLYAGYVGFSVAFSFAIAALLLGRLDSAWARWVRPWTLLAWIFLTIGIAIGSWWAYYELGWGGWWFWDPVENASLMPWLTGTALVHSAIVMEKRDTLKAWTVLLAVLTFSLSLLGTFLVRSGVITSVHSFASDPERGVFILALLVIFTGGGLLLFAWRARQFTSGGAFALVSREGAILWNNLILTASCGVVLIGTLYPMALEAVTGEKISVGAPFFNDTVVWIFLPLLLAIPFGIFLTWKRGDGAAVARRLIPPAIAAGLTGAFALFIGGAGGKAVLAMTIGAWVIAGSVFEVVWRTKFPQVSLSDAVRRLGSMRRGQFGATLGHLGMGITVVGVAVASAWNVERLAVMRPGDTLDIAGYEVMFKGVAPVPGPNYQETAGTFELKRGGTSVTTLIAAKRKYDAPPQTTTEAGIAPRPVGDVYVVLGDEIEPGKYSVRLYFHPFVRWIWIGAVIMFIGGAVSLLDRRLRMGLPKRARRRSVSPTVAAE